MRPLFVKKGFTLIELMIVVAIIGILAVIGVHFYSQHIKKAKASEAISFLGSIVQSQQAYFSEFYQFISVGNSNTAYYPATVNEQLQVWAPNPLTASQAGWDQLGVKPVGQVRFQYITRGGKTGENGGDASMLTAMGINYATGPWFWARARGNLNNDTDESNYSTFEVTHNRTVPFEKNAP